MATQGLSWRYQPLGEAALLVEADQATPLANRYVLALSRAVEALQLRGLGSVAPAIGSLLVTFDPLVLGRSRLERYIGELLAQLEPAPEVPARVVEIPVVYGGEAGPDLAAAAQRLGLSPGRVVAEHSAHIYRVMMIGFAPGFPYAGPLPPSLVLPRRATPRTAVPAGSVAIATGLTGIYPARLPGGWHIIGHTELPLFDPSASPPAALEPGDGLRFVPLSAGCVP